jgi:hypothetical protein
MPDVTFERTTLYEEVWTTPLIHLAKKYGLSDNGIRKVCKALNIPLPKQGHWAKVAAGHQIVRPALPNNAERTTFVSRPVEQETSRALEDEQWLAERIAFEENEENRITIEQKPARWHKVVVPIRDDLREAAKELEVSRRAEERAERHPRLRQLPNWDGYKWRMAVDRGQILRETHKSAPTRVSPLSYERALIILHTLCREGERRGFTISENAGRGRIAFHGHGAEILVRVSERLENKWRTEKSEWEAKPRKVRYQVPTGNLRIYVGTSWSEAETGDDDEIGLELKLNAVFVKMYRQVVRQRERRREHEAREKAWQADEARREAAEQRRREEEAGKQREDDRRRSLLVEARDWKTAALIREYANHVVKSNERELPGLGAWRTWALGVADALDPTPKRVTALATPEGADIIIVTVPRPGE